LGVRADASGLIGKIDNRPLALNKKIDKKTECVGGQLFGYKSMTCACDSVSDRSAVGASQMAQPRYFSNDTEVPTNTVSPTIIPTMTIHAAPRFGIDRRR
jgi:hypothetical protein